MRIDTARAAVNEVDDESSDTDVDAADAAIGAAKSVIAAAPARGLVSSLQHHASAHRDTALPGIRLDTGRESPGRAVATTTTSSTTNPARNSGSGSSDAIGTAGLRDRTSCWRCPYVPGVFMCPGRCPITTCRVVSSQEK